MTGLPPANVAVAPPRKSKIHSQRGIDGKAPRVNVRQPRSRQYQSGHQADRHPARVERQQHPDARHRDEFRSGPQPVDDAVARHRPQQHHRRALPGGGGRRHDMPPAAVGAARQRAVVQVQRARAQLLQARKVVGDNDNGQARAATQVFQQPQQAALARRVQAGQRLIEDERAR